MTCAALVCDGAHTRGSRRQYRAASATGHHSFACHVHDTDANDSAMTFALAFPVKTVTIHRDGCGVPHV